MSTYYLAYFIEKKQVICAENVAEQEN